MSQTITPVNHISSMQAEASPTFDPAAIKKHFENLHFAAENANVPNGQLVLTVFGEGITSVQHFAIDDNTVANMTAATMAYEDTPGANIYAPPAVFIGLEPGKKGTEAQVAKDLAKVIDGDADKGKEAPQPPMPANYVIESSAGNLQHWLWLDRPLPPAEAKQFGQAIKRMTGADCADDISHVWRVPGTLNWPTASKIKRGRSPAPQAVKIVTDWTNETGWTSVETLRDVLSPFWNAAPADCSERAPAAVASEWRREEVLSILRHLRANDDPLVSDGHGKRWASLLAVRNTGVITREEARTLLQYDQHAPNGTTLEKLWLRKDGDAKGRTMASLKDAAIESGWRMTAQEMFAGLANVIPFPGAPQPINPDLLSCNPPRPMVCEVEFEPEPALTAPQPFVWRDPSTLPRMPWLYGTHLLRGCVSLTVAAPGVGKTLEKITETVAMVTGLKLLHDTPKDKLRCWFYNGEEPMDILERRFHACFIRHKIKPEMLGDRLFVNDRTTKMVIAKQSRDGVTILEPVKELLISYILENKIDVLSIDPFVSAHAVTENDNVAIDQVVKAYADVAQLTSCSIDLVHHVRKTNGGPITIEDARGASSAIGAARAARTMNFMQPDEAKLAGIENRYRYVRIDDGKPNHAARAEKAQWVQLEGVWLGNDGLGMGDNVGVVTPWQWPDLTAEVKKGDVSTVWETIAAGNGKFRKDPRAGNWIGHPIAHALGLDMGTAQGLATVKKLITEWIRDGFLIVERRKDEERKDRDFVDLSPKAMKGDGQ